MNILLVAPMPPQPQAPGETFTDSLALDADTLGNAPLEGRLYRLNNPQEVYRQVIVQPNLQ